MDEAELEIVDDGEKVTITISPAPEGYSDRLLFSWVLLKLMQGFIAAHPDDMREMKQLVDIMFRDTEVLN